MSIAGVRVPLVAPPAVFSVDVGEFARISLAWWDDAGPVLVDRGAGPCTVVAVWPTDRRGYIDAPAVRRGEIRVMRWDLSDVHLQRLRAVIAAGWRVRRAGHGDADPRGACMIVAGVRFSHDWRPRSRVWAVSLQDRRQERIRGSVLVRCSRVGGADLRCPRVRLVSASGGVRYAP